MPVPGRRLAHEPASPYLGLVLLVTLVVAGVLAFEAHRASVFRRQTAERALEDYAAFAAWQLANVAATSSRERGCPRVPCAPAAPFFDSLLSRHPLLPPSLTRGVPNESLLAVTVLDSAGKPVWRSAAGFLETVGAGYRASPEQGGLVYRVALRRDAAASLLIGGIPTSRLPWLYALLGLCAVLVGLALVQLRREYELARLRTGFVSGVSHELRTPLAQIRLFAETLRLARVRTEEERAHALEVIDRESRRLTSLVDNVLQFSRAERGVTRITPERSRVDELVAETLKEFEPLAEARRVVVAPSLEQVTASVDGVALRQMLLNLLDNAVKYGPVGQTVSVRATRSDGMARLVVEDSGPGVPRESRERIFEPFYRLERESEAAISGGGVGLAVVRELAELHGGRAWVEPREGGVSGSRFVVELPA